MSKELKRFRLLPDSGGYECIHCGIWTHMPVEHRSCCNDTQIAELREEVEWLKAALTPSAETKGAYMGEVRCGCHVNCDNNHLPWTVIKKVMKLISKRAEGGE